MLIDHTSGLRDLETLCTENKFDPVGGNADWICDTWCIDRMGQYTRYGLLIQDTEDGMVSIVWAPHNRSVSPWDEDYYEKHYKQLWQGRPAELTREVLTRVVGAFKARHQLVKV